MELAYMHIGEIVDGIREKEESEDAEDEEGFDESGEETEEDFISEEDVQGESGISKDSKEEAEDLQTLYRQVSREREREAVLARILEAVTSSISNRAKKRPDDIINGYKANKINALLTEIRVKYQGSWYEDLLEMIRPPEETEEDGRKYITGMTYSDVEVLLNHYATILRYVRVREKE